MDASVQSVEDGIALVEVIDGRSNRHLVEVDVDTGDLGRHGQDAYPRPDSPARADEHDRLLNRVRERARFEVHVSTAHDVVDPEWDPAELERAIEALRNMPLDAFEAAFGEYYRLLDDPDRLLERYGTAADAPRERDDIEVTMAAKGFCVDAADEVATVPAEVLFYYTWPGLDGQYRGGENPTCPAEATRFTVLLPRRTRPPAEGFDYPADFRGALVENLACQIRDVFLNMGEPVPTEYDLGGLGKVISTLHVDVDPRSR